jgi:putative transposase
MILAHKIRLNPTPEQATYFGKAAGVARFVYNWGLARWIELYEAGEKPTAFRLKKEFNALKREQFPWVTEVAKDVAEGAFVNLEAAFKNYFESLQGQRRGEKIGYPKFKSKKRSKLSFHLNNDKFKVDDHWLYVPKLGWVNMAEALRLEGKIMGATISKTADWWYASIQVEIEPPPPREFPKDYVGIDLGVLTLATLSEPGTESFESQRPLRAQLRQLKRLNRELSRRQEGSQRWLKTKRKLARLHKRIADRRNDHIHKMTTSIARTYRIISIEDLNLKGMIQNRPLALSVSDAALGEVARQLQYKAEINGGFTVKVDRFYPSSKICGVCGEVNDNLTLSDREWRCEKCGTVHDRDRNASQNIERETLRLVGV